MFFHKTDFRGNYFFNVKIGYMGGNQTENQISHKLTYRLGQVGGFPLRLYWLPKLVSVAKSKKKPFAGHAEILALEMGIGVNMVKALRVWAKATGVISNEGDERVTERGKKLFSPDNGLDKYAEEEATLWLLHWLICSNVEYFTANGWLFNFYNARSFSAVDAWDAFFSHMQKIPHKKSYVKGSIRLDVETTLRMYAMVEDKKRREELYDHHFRNMLLLSARRVSSGVRYSRIFLDERLRLDSAVIAYAVIDYLSKRGVSYCSFSDLYAGNDILLPAPGIVFGYTRDGFFNAIEKITTEYPGIMSVRTMPDGDYQVKLHGKYATAIEKSDQRVADDFYFSESENKK